MPEVKLAPSILAADFLHLGANVEEAIQAGADFIHVDVMDGHFVPNLSIGVPVVQALKPLSLRTGVPLDVHLMIEKPENLLEAFAKAGANILTVHVEACPDLRGTLRHIHDLGVKAGVSLRPATLLSAIEPMLGDVDRVLVMSVNPGFGGQAYIPFSTRKVADLRRMLDARGLTAEIGVDGGVGPKNAREIVGAGADVLIAGTSVFNRKTSIAESMRRLREAAL